MKSFSCRRLAGLLMILIGFALVPVLAQEIPGVPPESEYYYRIHYEKVETIMKVPDLAEREKQLLAFMKGLNPKSKILQFMPSFLHQIAEEYQKAGKADQAKALNEKINQLFPPQETTSQAMAKAFAAKNYAKAIEEGEKIYASNPDRQVAYILFESYVATNNAAKAAEFGGKVVDSFGAKEGVRAVAWLARYYAGQRNVDQAAHYASQLAAAFPEGAVPSGWPAENWKSECIFAHTLLGDVAYGKKDYKGAIAAYGEALKYDAKNDYPYFRIGSSHWRLQELDKAMANFAMAVVIGKTSGAKAREYLEQIYKPLHNNSLDGLDQLLAKAKAALAQ